METQLATKPRINATWPLQNIRYLLDLGPYMKLFWADLKKKKKSD